MKARTSSDEGDLSDLGELADLIVLGAVPMGRAPTGDRLTEGRLLLKGARK
jgi:hypothetical protein